MGRVNDDGSIEADPMGAAIEAGRMLDNGHPPMEVAAAALVSIAESLAILVQERHG